MKSFPLILGAFFSLMVTAIGGCEGNRTDDFQNVLLQLRSGVHCDYNWTYNNLCRFTPGGRGPYRGLFSEPGSKISTGERVACQLMAARCMANYPLDPTLRQETIAAVDSLINRLGYSVQAGEGRLDVYPSHFPLRLCNL